MSAPRPHWPKNVELTLRSFYSTERAGAVRLSDGGGPFGFDITVALLVDDLLAAYDCDSIVETGCYLGDTTAYLARRYPDRPLYACDIDHAAASFTRIRLADENNATVECIDSPALVARIGAAFRRPLYFLDAHWGKDWPLLRELDAIECGVVMIHDFDVGHPRFAFDAYNGLTCGPDILARMAHPPRTYFTPDPAAAWPLPCLQVGRRAGLALVAIGVDPTPLEQHSALHTRQLHLETEVTQ